MLDLYKENKKYTVLVHRIVAIAFIENPNNLDQVNHIDGNKENNCITNLEWCSQSQNIEHAHKNNLNKISSDALEKLSKNVKGISPKDRKKKVIQKDKNGNIIAEYESLIEASKIVGINRATIRDAITGRRGAKTAKGYYWEYAN